MTVTTGAHRSPARGRPLSALPAWAALAAGIVVLHAAGGALPAPPLRSPSTWSGWMAGRDPVVVAFSTVRLLALGAVWYGAAVSAAGVGLRLVSAVRLASLLDRLTVVPLRRLVAASVAVVITTGPVAATAARAATGTEAPGPPPTVTMQLVAPAPDNGPPTSQAPTSQAPTSQAPTSVPVPGAPEVAGGASWAVQPGECFWSIAEAELARVRGRRPSPAEIVPYWHRLIEANRSTLADPANPDLVFPGQVFTLPEP